MKKKITVFLIDEEHSYNFPLEDELAKNENVREVIFIGGAKQKSEYSFIKSKDLFGSDTIKKIAQKTKTDYLLLQIKNAKIILGQFCIQRFLTVAQETSAGIIYSDFYEQRNEGLTPHPLIEYQPGSLRDDFNFGYFILIKSDILQKTVNRIKKDLKFSGLYSLRLAISKTNRILRIPEFLYTVEDNFDHKTDEKQFEYVDSKNREVQIEFEKVVTEYLKKIDAFVKPVSRKINFKSEKFQYEASVIIPVKNREKTIDDAVNSVLQQKTKFNFNVIVVDNNSTDRTTAILKEISSRDNRVIHLIPERQHLGIGGCWNEAIFHKKCGKFAVQLDSDDLYIDENTLQKIVECFYKEKCGMVIGSYKLTDFYFKEIPPGVVDHKEWTDENGPNNALRINGLGAPRAYYTPLIRDIKFPNVNYGEDYAVVLSICGKYKIGRIFEPIYICRRWEGNTDSSLTTEQENRNNYYKDKIRTIEIFARQKVNI